MLLQVTLNGSRFPEEHPHIPVSPGQIALQSRHAVEACAHAIHMHPRGEEGQESLAAADLSAALHAVRAAEVTAPIGVSTGEWIEPDVTKRLERIDSWTVLPDFASVNFHERGAREVARLLLSLDIGMEAGIHSVEAAKRFTAFAQSKEALRVLIEIPDLPPDQATRLLHDIEHVLDHHSPGLPRLLHGYEGSAWPMIKKAAQRNYYSRIGLEDTLYLPGQKIVYDNTQLVQTAVQMIKKKKSE
ncbi:3-keto-5-aminohexanoate cleavage protein [Fodinibius sediminis]|uniref:Uncharacterized conserved protein, DUF849 family n=1 Tax=Fodinibius sediminis TaxID=1214077 RepID=A0A521E844_9BACT|nr:3-keto-5-aminohexanoate cleavage protein [Fodinibius sediminis]SMO79340.1 Uncharacterized conserved protein, DUF849 family [Fodinibius sediminis]